MAWYGMVWIRSSVCSLGMLCHANVNGLARHKMNSYKQTLVHKYMRTFAQIDKQRQRLLLLLN